MKKRKLHAYCVGTGRSGARSMAGIFSSCYRSGLEPHKKELFTVIPALQKGLISKEDFREYAIYLDHKLQLELNASFLNTWQLDIFMTEFPDAKFIVTIRDCYSWLNSFINDLYVQRPRFSPEAIRFLDMILGQGAGRYAKEEQPLYEKGPYTLDGFLSYWARINNQIFSTLPSSRILVIKTHEISDRDKISKIADFLNIPLETLDLAQSHLGKNIKCPNILSKIDKDYLSFKVNSHCKDLMDKFFPGFIYTFE